MRSLTGIRSLQAMVMIALLLGELRDLNLIRRVALLAFAVAARDRIRFHGRVFQVRRRRRRLDFAKRVETI